jgi:hypothetical protein
MEDKITIIEGPPPTFEAVGDSWVLSLNETPAPFNIALTRLRTFKGQELIERCHRAWRHQDSIHLEYRGLDGLENQAPILAARALEIDEGQMLFLWVRLEVEETELEPDFGGDLDDTDSDPDDDA